MTLIAVHSPQDIVRLNTGTVEGTYRAISQDLERRKIILFNYDAARKAIEKRLAGKISLEQAIAGTQAKGTLDSRRYNTEVVTSVWNYIEDLHGVTIPASPKFIEIGFGLATKFKPLCYLNTDGKLAIIMDQFRKNSTAPSDETIKILSSVVIDQFAQDEFINAQTLFIDAKARNGEKVRSTKIHQLSVADKADVALFNEVATIYSRAFMQYARETEAEIRKSSLVDNSPDKNQPKLL